MAAKKTLSQRIAADPRLKAKYLKNPGLRSKLDAKYLTPAQRKTRETNAYNKAPVTPGSTLTNRDVAREADTATMVQYGSAGRELQSQQQREQAVGRDTAGWYDAYRRELQQHTANTQAMNAAAAGQVGQLATGMRGLDQTALTGQQTAANADAATRGASAANLGPDASNASLVRQQMIGNFGIEQVGLGGAATRLADARANVVAPTQKLQAQLGSAQKVRDVGKDIVTLKEKAGAYNTNYRATRKADETKNVLANQALGLDVAKAKTTADLGAARIAATKRGQDISRGQSAASLAETTRSHRANETAAQARIRIARETAAKKKAGKPVHGPGSLTPVAENKLLSTIRQVQQRLDHPTKTVVDPTTGAKTRKPATPAEALADLRGADVDPDAIAVARSLKANGGKLDTKGVEAAHRLGIHVGPNWKVVRKAKPKPVDLARGKTSISSKPPVSLRP